MYLCIIHVFNLIKIKRINKYFELCFLNFRLCLLFKQKREMSIVGRLIKRAVIVIFKMVVQTIGDFQPACSTCEPLIFVYLNINEANRDGVALNRLAAPPFCIRKSLGN